MQRVLILLGIALVLLGILWPWLGKLPIGRLPGDIVVEKDNFRLFFPITTMVIISLALTLILWLFKK
ncbi:MAG: DUF2905 domain-containing protein [Chromatiaceae bacterium]|jgi:uncharacterized protein HemY